MILNGNSRGSGANLARHLLRTDENDHVQVLQVLGFASNDLLEAFQEAQLIASTTKCKKYLFSLSLSPPYGADATEADFLKAIEKTEKALGLVGQPRVIVLHEKGDNRDRHAHAVWARINIEEMKAIPLPYNRLKIREVSRDLFIEHGWDMPRGLINREQRNPLTYTFDQYQQAKRVGKHASDIKAVLQDAWAISDSPAALSHALLDKGYRLAQGDRRSFVVVDYDGEVYNLPKWLGIKTKMVRERLGQDIELPSVDQAKAAIGKGMLAKLDGYQVELNKRDTERKGRRLQARQELVQRQRAERQAELKAIEDRRIAEAIERQARFRKGLAGIWDWVRGETARLRVQCTADAQKMDLRDKAQTEALIVRQRAQRRLLSDYQHAQRQYLKDQYRLVAEDRALYDDMSNLSKDERFQAVKRRHRDASAHRPRRRKRGPLPER